MNNAFLKSSVLTLTLGLLSNTSIATNDAHDNEHSGSMRSATAKQLSLHYTEDQLEELQKLVFSGEPLLNIGSYLGRQETGRLQQVNRSVKHFFNQAEEVLPLWKRYAQQLQLEVTGDIKVKDLISQVRNYYKPQIDVLVDNSDLRFKNFNILCSNFKGSVFGGWAWDRQDNNKLKAVICKDGILQPVGQIENGKWGHATAISADGTIIAGWTWDNNKPKAVIWKNGILQVLGTFDNGKWSHATAISADGIVAAGQIYYGQGGDKSEAVIWKRKSTLYLNAYPFKQYHDSLSSIISMSRNGSDFTVRSETGKSYIAHIPRYDLWNMNRIRDKSKISISGGFVRESI